ncbi:NAD(P)-dependent oxidoreductase [Ornithinimicrobium sp. Y1847]|uniref:NAD(P)-dependent oxidoreductase n=1 Tax=Ornithinimicrobium sp. Y1847 TaxID=3405419 RepID=UPI003B682EC5
MDDTRTEVGFLALGPMGLPMATALVSAGHHVHAWNRTGSVTEAFAAHPAEGGRATAHPSPAAVARSADVVVSMLPELRHTEEVVDGPDGLLAGWAERGGAPVLVVMGTVSPVGVVELGERLAEHGVRVVDAPVSGGPQGAWERRLAIMVGGAEEDVARVRPLLEAMGSTVRHLGPAGAGQLTKACNQTVVAGTLAALGEAVRLAQAGGLDVEAVLEVLGGGLAGSEALRQKGPRYISGDFSGGGACRNQLKDLDLILEAGSRYGVSQPVSRLTRELYGRMVERGEGELDHAAVLRALEEDALG